MPMEVPFFFPGMFMVVAGVAVCVGWLMFRSQSRSRSLSRGESEHIYDAIEELRADVDVLRRELTDVHERLDFTERVLGQASGARFAKPE